MWVQWETFCLQSEIILPAAVTVTWRSTSAETMSSWWTTAVCLLVWKFIERNKKESDSFHVFRCLSNKADSDRTWSYSPDSRRGCCCREDTHSKMLMFHTHADKMSTISSVSIWTPEICHQLSMWTNVKYGHSLSPSVPEIWCCITARTVWCHSEVDLWPAGSKISSLHSY